MRDTKRSPLIPLFTLFLTSLSLPLGCAEPDAGDDETGDGETDETGETGETGDLPLEIAGEYTDEWGSSHTITDASWSFDTALFHVESYDNDADFLIAQNDEANDYSPGLWSRFDWVFVESDLFYCQSAFDAADAAAAAATARPDDSDPASSGCGGTFPWTKMN